MALLSWIAEGLSSTEINKRAAASKSPFSVSPQQVDYYRKTRESQLKAIASISEDKALTEGFALTEHRVYKLSLLAALMEQDIMGGVLWTSQVKGLGGAENFQIVEYEEFNAAEVKEYRGVLDDIASETGGRVKNVDVKSDGKAIRVIDDIQYDRSLAALSAAAAERTGIHNPDAAKESPVDTAEPPAMAGADQSG